MVSCSTTRTPTLLAATSPPTSTVETGRNYRTPGQVRDARELTATSDTRTRKCVTSSSTAWRASPTSCLVPQDSSTMISGARALGPRRATGQTASTARRVSGILTGQTASTARRTC
uniref:Uncharacterized protein n=1 Tax=Timema cristinae TaxID=61476 RepID=A0A7R9HF19_TIMCR|nr:unnamed protein product [Timema cristinae]